MVWEDTIGQEPGTAAGRILLYPRITKGRQIPHFSAEFEANFN